MACFGICFVMGVNAKVSSTWFPDNERSKCISLVQMAGILGTLVSFVMAPLFVSDHKKEDWNPEFKSLAYSQINKYIFI